MADVTNVEKGTEYEQFVQDVYQAIVSAEGVETIKVEHNIQLGGNSGCEHQIDVYWEFRLAGQTYKTAIECKAYNQNVSIGKIRDFYGVLVDVPGLTGIFATLVGYQSGAKKYAEHYGISLKELREPTDADWQGRIQDINLNLHVVKVQVKSFQPRVAPAFLATLKADERFEMKSGFQSNEPIVFEKSGGAALSWDDLRKQLPTSNKQESNVSHFLRLSNHVLRIQGMDIDIEGIDYVYDVNVETLTHVIRGKLLAKAIVKDVASGNLTFIDKKGRVKEPRG
jgi:hypothetical protein